MKRLLNLISVGLAYENMSKYTTSRMVVSTLECILGSVNQHQIDLNY